MKIKAIFSVVMLTLQVITLNACATANSVVDELTLLSAKEQAPLVYQKEILENGMQSFFFDGAPYKGKPTRIFAYYKKPQGKGPFPAMVLVHGGGGSAFQDWVKKWNDAGFAAISIATEGQTGTLSGQKQPKWIKHEWGGPRRPGIYNDPDEALQDQWMYQASYAAINAHTLLRSFSDIKKDQIGLTGISWGGVITSTVIGFDQRFAFAIPIYGCGFLDGMDNKYGKALKDNQSYKKVWEPGLRIAKFKAPTFWMTGLKENNFSLDAQASTYGLLKGSHYQSIQPDLKHSHIFGWTPKEPYLFAQSVINDQVLPSFYQHQLTADKASVRVKNAGKISSASLFYTNDEGHTFTRKWHEIPLKIVKNNNDIVLDLELPKSATAWVFNINKNGLTYSSEFQERNKL